MKISTRARYGMRLMLDLAFHHGEGPVFLKDIAKSEEISEKYLSQIIIPLKAIGLINSFRGAHGGYVLARPPEKIKLNEIVGILEGNFNLVDCVKKPDECSRVPICVTRNLWKMLGETISMTLEKMSLADLLNQCKKNQERPIIYNI
ncbi:MAG: Rrf2 family transcriptional regulator [Candidatus Omnitrophica bacterium]|nr:Rrf2 family transcriptional regulator [Candidatus Omnitrophota bacterium]